jgi:tripartite-type tricarboxylate transporter receptor subunit TctC
MPPGPHEQIDERDTMIMASTPSKYRPGPSAPSRSSRVGAALVAGALAAAFAAPSAAQQAWPSKPVRIEVPAPAGSSLDVIVRILGEKLKDRWKQPVVVENKAGAGGMLGMDVVAKAPPDGYTLGIGFNGPIAFGPFMYKKMPYDPAKDLLPVVLTTIQPNVLAIPTSNPSATLPDFIEWSKRQPAGISYGSVGNGSSSHLTMELLKTAAGIDAVHVPYGGSPPASASLAAGETQALFTVQPALLPLIQGNRVKIIAVASLKRDETMKEVPTIAESGYPGFEALAWNGLFAPAGTPPELVARIGADVDAVLKDASVREQLAKQGLTVGGGTPAEFRSFIDSETRKWGPIIKKANITIE